MHLLDIHYGQIIGRVTGIQGVMKIRSLCSELKVKGDDDISVKLVMTHVIIRKKVLHLSHRKGNFRR